MDREAMLAHKEKGLMQWAEKNLHLGIGEMAMALIMGTEDGIKVSLAEFPIKADELSPGDFTQDVWREISALPFGRIGQCATAFFRRKNNQPQKGQTVMRACASSSMGSVLNSVNGVLSHGGKSWRLRRIQGDSKKPETEARYQFS